MAPVNREGQAWCPEQDAQLRDLLARGMTTKEVARVIGRTPVAVALRAKRLGLKRKKPRSPNTIMAQRLLAEQALTPHELAAKLGMRLSSVYRLLVLLRPELYVERWTKGASAPPLPHWRAGTGKDAPKPKPTPVPVLQKRYLQRMKEERPADYYAKVRRSNARRARKARPDTAAAWIVPQQGE